MDVTVRIGPRAFPPRIRPAEAMAPDVVPGSARSFWACTTARPLLARMARFVACHLLTMIRRGQCPMR
jgi:hypothetical protein